MSYEQCQGTSVSYVGENLPCVNPAINGKVSAWLQSQEPDICAQGTVIFLKTGIKGIHKHRQIAFVLCSRAYPLSNGAE